ncbi:hypothetical protein DWY39_03580 [Roseburia sp. AF25-15LB]|nr:hypothetical protein DW059_01955 [Roseburia sp. AF42-8]RHQ42706.1 hypothetical protein DWY49_04550 [Roseburia sp. AF25-25LB]RHQ50491.1 hypothetical protein DWY39_03580 [Roseburia sp. AF25-15LB]
MITAESFLFDVATATTEMERSGIEVLWLAGWGFLMMWRQPRLRWSVSGIEVAVLVLMPESFRSCGDSHD